MTLNKAEAARALGISLRTLANRMQAGTVKYTKVENARIGEQSVFFTLEGLGLREPSAAPVQHDVPINSNYEDAPAPKPAPVQAAKHNQPSEIDAKAAEDAAWAQAYREGRVTDSMGNKIDGTNAKWPNRGTVSVLGPVTVDPGPPVETQSHMHQGLLGTNTTEGVPVEAPRWGFENEPEAFTRSGRPLCAGLSQENYDSMMKDWNKRGGGRSQCEMEIASRRAVDNISNSFPKG